MFKRAEIFDHLTELSMRYFRKKIKKQTVVTTLIGSSTHVDTNFLSFTGGIHIQGHVGLDVVGSEDSATAISILENGEVDGDVRAVDVFIAGVVHGNVYATEIGRAHV